MIVIVLPKIGVDSCNIYLAGLPVFRPLVPRPVRILLAANSQYRSEPHRRSVTKIAHQGRGGQGYRCTVQLNLRLIYESDSVIRWMDK